MYDNGFKLISGLVRKYLAKKTEPGSSKISDSLTSETHNQWSVEGEFGMATITATRLTDENTILNFISGENARAVQVSLAAIGVSAPVKVAEISPESLATFTQFVDGKLCGEGGFWQSPSDAAKRSNSESQRSKLGGSYSDPKRSEDPLHDIPQIATKPIGKGQRKPSDMPEFEDEYELKGRANVEPQTGVFGIGERDLNPPGLSRDPLMKPYLDPLAGGAAGGGMYPTADHPIFGSQSGNTSRLGVPPGARFDDPYGEDNLEDMGMGLPGNLRHSPFGGGRGSGPGGSPFGGAPFGGGMF